MKQLRLVAPCEAYMDGHLQFCREMKDSGSRNFMIDDPDAYDEWRDGYAQRCAEYSRGIGLPDGWVPYTRLWLMDGDELVGVISIRHRLNEQLREMGGHIGYGIKPSKWRQGYGAQQLRLALPVARELGIERALITCNDENIASARIIEKNGGVLEGVFDVVRDGAPIRLRRYWVET